MMRDAKVIELINEEEGMNEEGGIYWKTWREYQYIITGINEQGGDESKPNHQKRVKKNS